MGNNIPEQFHEQYVFRENLLLWNWTNLVTYFLEIIQLPFINLSWSLLSLYISNILTTSPSFLFFPWWPEQRKGNGQVEGQLVDGQPTIGTRNGPLTPFHCNQKAFPQVYMVFDLEAQKHDLCEGLVLLNLIDSTQTNRKSHITLKQSFWTNLSSWFGVRESKWLKDFHLNMK